MCLGLSQVLWLCCGRVVVVLSPCRHFRLACQAHLLSFATDLADLVTLAVMFSHCQLSGAAQATVGDTANNGAARPTMRWCVYGSLSASVSVVVDVSPSCLLPVGLPLPPLDRRPSPEMVVFWCQMLEEKRQLKTWSAQRGNSSSNVRATTPKAAACALSAVAFTIQPFTN